MNKQGIRVAHIGAESVEAILYSLTTPQSRRKKRLEYMRAQGGACLHCGHQLLTEQCGDSLKGAIDTFLFPEGMFDYPVHLHHCHESGWTIGAVHAHCNAILWQFHGE